MPRNYYIHKFGANLEITIIVISVSIGGRGNKQRREGFTSARRVSREEYSFKVNLRKNGKAEKDCCGFTQREQEAVPFRYVCVSNYIFI